MDGDPARNSELAKGGAIVMVDVRICGSWDTESGTVDH